MRLLVCGGRDFEDAALMYRILNELHAQHVVTELIEGGQVSYDLKERTFPWAARRKWGADYFAGQWAVSMRVPHTQVKADWKKFGRAAGPIRNREMLALKPDMVAAFPTPRSVGTHDMIDIASKAHVPVLVTWSSPEAEAEFQRSRAIPD